MLSKIGFKQVRMPHSDEPNFIPLVINRFRVNAVKPGAKGLENPIKGWRHKRFFRVMEGVLKSILGGNHKKVDFPGAVRAMHHSGFDIGGFAGAGYKCQAIG